MAAMDTCIHFPNTKGTTPPLLALFDRRQHEQLEGKIGQRN